MHVRPGHSEVEKTNHATDPALPQRYLDAGALFVMVGVDTTLLVQAASVLVRRFNGAAVNSVTSVSGGY